MTHVAGEWQLLVVTAETWGNWFETKVLDAQNEEVDCRLYKSALDAHAGHTTMCGRYGAK